MWTRTIILVGKRSMAEIRLNVESKGQKGPPRTISGAGSGFIKESSDVHAKIPKKS
jgi:hypothetical protein